MTAKTTKLKSHIERMINVKWTGSTGEDAHITQ